MSWQFDVEKFRRRFVARGQQLAEISPALSKPSASPREWNDDDYSANSRYWTKWEARDDVVFPPISDDVVKKFDPSPENLFVPDMKVEAVDRRYPGLVCIATIFDVDGERVRVYFDGWNHNYDYWCHYTSPEIRPIGTAAQIGLSLQTPGTSRGQQWLDEWRAGGSNWKGYLTRTNTKAAPLEAFHSCYRFERDEQEFSLQDMVVRVILRSGFNVQSAEKLLPPSIKKLILNARKCPFCGGPFLWGVNTVDYFTCQKWLCDDVNRVGRTAVTCSVQCAKALLNRMRSSVSSSSSREPRPHFICHQYAGHSLGNQSHLTNHTFYVFPRLYFKH
ncbi:uncharacterized protein [Oscarella lobularis]|uniref:uncharacterized protein n=1 Tax=Oscarella lobularis TaxID=121494 RepID=UPI003313ECF7